MIQIRSIRITLFVLLGLIFFSCNDPTFKLKGFLNLKSDSILYKVSGSISGLNGTIIIQNNLSNDLSLITNGSFTFTNSLSNNSTYSISILTQPSLQTCTITNGNGTISNSDVTNILINCSNSSSINTLSNLSISSGFLNPIFSSSTLAYTFTVLNSISTFTITPTATDINATIRVNGTSVTSGIASGSINLNVGSNMIQIIVQAQDNSTRTYTLTIVRSTINFYRIFVTSNSYDGNLKTTSTGILGADSKCNLVDTNKPTDGSVYKAIIVDGTNRAACSTTNNCTQLSENIDWVLKANTQYAKPNGTLILTTNTAGIFPFGVLGTNFNTGVEYWTGISTVSFWKVSGGGNHCSNWETNNSALIGNLGDGSSTNYTSFASSTNTCDVLKSLLCAEQ